MWFLLLSRCCPPAGNFIGSLLFVAAVVASGVLAPGAMYPIKTALYKATLPWHQVSPVLLLQSSAQ